MSSGRRQSQPFLCLASASFRLGERLVFQHTSWSFREHEQWAVIGPNGSGKSLFADALRGRLPLVEGDLQYFFRPPLGLSAEEAIAHVSFEDRKRELGERTAQSRWNSIEQEGALPVEALLSYERVMEVNPFEIHPQSERARPQFERLRRRAIELLELRPFLKRTVLSLSNGETQRLQLARALCHPMRLLILDEPFIGLDAATRKYFHTVLERMMDTPVRVLVMTTRVEDLPRHTTHLMYLEDCRVIAAGRRAEVLRSLRSLTVLPTTKNRAPARPHPWRLTVGRRGAERGRELVKLRNVTVRYGKALILNRLNWTVREGESWALLGPNGAGKTTVLSLIMGDNPQAYENEVEVFGRQRGSGESIWELKRRIGWVSPELHLHFDQEATCFEVVASGFAETVGVYEPPTARQRAAARAWLNWFGLAESFDAPLFSLSVGLQRLVFLARALAKAPRLLVLDEPCQGLDAEHRKLVVDTVEGLLRSRALTAIYVTHRAEEIPGSIKRVLRLQQAGGSRRVARETER